MTKSISKKLLRIGAVCARYGDVDPSTIYKWVKAGKFPEPVQVSRQITGWWSHELDEHDESLTRGVRVPNTATAA